MFSFNNKCFKFTDILLKYVLKTHWSIKTSSVEDTGLIKESNKSVYCDELSPYFVKTDPLNKDSFIIPPPNLVLLSEFSNPETNNLIKLFDNYFELFTEILIRLPYQMKKLCLGSNTNDILNQIGTQFNFSQWIYYLCEYLIKFKDEHILSTCLNQLVSICPLSVNPKPFSMLGMSATMSEALKSMNSIQSHVTVAAQKISKLSYLNLIKIFDNLILILEVSSSRSTNWQKFCLQNPSTSKSYFVLDRKESFNGHRLECTSVIIPTILQLLQSLFGQKSNSKIEQDENLSQLLVGVILKQILIKFSREFLLEAFQS
ncbi:unnamed protein product [Brachionus calyciflorus]|uniref:Uncharacterized protein n=1 Tax=Brachionus calyciflorus TaxID=104777 RepID=A0A814RZR7_9BILA|nr:unnamed protein product [Brachionus calyciflorus]